MLCPTLWGHFIPVAWPLGGNFNQVMHRANELAIDGKLSENYFRVVVMPEVKETVKTIMGIKTGLDNIHDFMDQV